jgi:hypothetical protein
MGDDPDALAFRVSTTDLTHLIEMLRQAGGLSRYPEVLSGFRAGAEPPGALLAT